MGWSWAAARGVQGRGHMAVVARLQLVTTTIRFPFHVDSTLIRRTFDYL